MMFSRLKFSIILFALPILLKFTARRHPAFAARLKQRNLVAQIKTRDEEIGRWISIRDGKISSGWGMHAKPDVTLSFKNATIGASLLTPPINWLDQINAQKDFMLAIDGPEDLTNWLAQTLMMMQTSRLEIRRPPALRLCLVDKRMVNRFNSSRQPISLVCRSVGRSFCRGRSRRETRSSNLFRLLGAGGKRRGTTRCGHARSPANRRRAVGFSGRQRGAVPC